MDKINYITEQQDHIETQELSTAPVITYDYIMSRLTRHIISREVSNTTKHTNRTQIPIEKKPNPASYHVASKVNKTANNERLPGYVKPYIGRPPTGNLNTPVNNQIQPIVNDRQTIEKHIRDLASPNNNNSKDANNKLLLMRKIALHNNKVMNDKIKLEKTQLKFQ
jgi:hypothetical protein